MNEEITISQLDPTTFEIQEYKTSDVELIALSDLDTEFSASTDYIEFYIYDENQTKIYPQSTIPLTSFNIKAGDVLLNPQSDLENLGYDIGKYSIVYDFYRKRLSSNISDTYFIREISSDRTEIRLDSNIIDNLNIISSTNEFISYRENTPYFADFSLNFGNGKTVIANNLSLDTTETEDPTILIKLYEPLPEEFSIKTQLWVVEEISKAQAYQVNFPFIPIIEDDFEFIAGPNFNLNVKQESGNSSQEFSYGSLIQSDVTSSINQIKNLLNSKEIKINVNYENFSDFTHFSTVLTRLENFYYKTGLIEGYTNEVNILQNNITSGTTTSFAYSSSLNTLNSQIDSIIQNLDGYEYFMYFNSGSDFSYPKTNTQPPFTLASTGSTEVLNWLGSADEDNTYYGGLALSASIFDEDNMDRLYNTIPEYLKEDPDNVKYELFIDMVAQHYDNTWLYTKDITNKFDGDNRLEHGISKDLIADAIKDFGVKLYSNNFNNKDLFTAFLGLTSNSDSFPFPEMTGSLPTPSGFEYVDTKISSSNDIIPLDDVNKRLYKRIYHNIPYLLKTKGTIAGLRALITSYGIPDTILRVNEFGGKDRNEAHDYDLKQNVFNYAFSTGGDADNFISSSLEVNSDFGSGVPQTIQFRFKTPGIPAAIDNVASTDIRYSQSLWSTNDGGNLVLEYEGAGLTSGSYSGSSVDSYDTWGTLKWIPAYDDNPEISASVYLPIFNQDWWSVQITMDPTDNTSTLDIANEINGKIGFTGSDSTTGYDSSFYEQSTIGYLNKDVNITLGSSVYQPFSGSFQELRYWNSVIPQHNFFDFTTNPYSTEGTTTNSAPNELLFRADLGTELNIDSRTSIHPRVTGSASQITSSFENGSSFDLQTGNDDAWVTNVENVYQDQVPAGIKNRVTDKITTNSTILPENPSGSNEDTIVLSQYQSIQQDSFTSGSYTPNINYLEVALSPQDQINDDINAQIGYFNLGDYIGDPRDISSNERSYPNLDTLRDAYFDKYISSYNVVDFIRLIKFFDNSLFKMIKDFTPARTSLTSGVVVKQHILERNKQRPAQASWSNETYSGSVKPQSRNYNTGSGDVGQYESTDGSSIYKFTGGTGGSLEHYNGLNTSPSASAYGLTNRFNLTQSYSESIEGSIADRNTNSGSFVGYGEVEVFDQREFYDGEFSGSTITATTQSLNPGCAPYLNVSDTTLKLKPLFFSLTQGVRDSTLTKESFLNPQNFPSQGEVWIAYEYFGNQNQVVAIKFPTLDVDGAFIRDYIDDFNKVQFFFGDESAEYYITNIVRYSNGASALVSTTLGDFTVTGSTSGGSKNWSIEASGSFNTLTTVNTRSLDTQQQGVFLNPYENFQSQNIFYWDGGVKDELGYFNEGAASITTENILTTSSNFISGSYSIPETPNVGWEVRGLIEYSASFTNFSGDVVSQGSYHIGTGYPSGAYNQGETLTNLGDSTSFIPAPNSTDLTGVAFDSSYNEFIPGNSGSGIPLNIIGGHPKLLYDATSSIDVDFGTLKLSGSYSPSQGTAEWVPFSGSNLNSSNGNFAIGTTPPQAVGIVQFLSASLDGSLKLIIQGMEDYASLYPQNPEGSSVSSTSVTFVQLKPRYTFSASPGLNVSASWEYASAGDPYLNPVNWEGAPTGSNDNMNTGDVSGNWSLDPQQYTSLLLPEVVSSIWVRPRVKTGEDDFTYTMSEYDLDLVFRSQTDYSDNRTEIETFTITDIFSSTGQNTPTIGYNEFTGSFNSTGDLPTIDLQAHLKITGSNGERIIASSIPKLNKPIYPGAELNFGGIISNIYEDQPISATTQSTRNDAGDLYFIEYELTDYTPGTIPGLESIDVNYTEFQTEASYIYITSSFPDTGLNYDLTGSVYLTQGNIDNPTSIGTKLFNNYFEVADENVSNGIFEFTSSIDYPFNVADSFRMGISTNSAYKSGLVITSYSMSISPKNSVNSPLTVAPAYNNFNAPETSGLYLPSYFGEGVLPFDKALDCQPTLNNYTSQRENTWLMDVDYSVGSITPVNQNQILSGGAVKATTPDSNYTALRSIKPRYEGTKTTGHQYNIWTVRDVDTYGKSPVIELRDAYFGYFGGVKNLYPLVNDKTSLDLTYLIDPQGNAIPPSLDGLGKDILDATFPPTKPITLGFISASEQFQEFDDQYNIYKLTEKPTPIMFTQTSSRGYSSELPLTGSGRISMYDDPGSEIVDYSFTAQGSGSATATETGYGSYNYDLLPTEDITTDPYGLGNGFYINPYSNGISTFHNSTETGNPGVETNPQRISLETSFATSFLYESGKAEVVSELKMLKGSVGVEFDLEDITLTVYRQGKEPKDLGSVIAGDIIKFIGPKYRSSSFWRTTTKTKKSNSILYNPGTNSYKFTIENVPLNNFLLQKGVYKKNTGGIDYKGDITGLEFKIKANSGGYQIQPLDVIKFNLDIILRKGRGAPNKLFPTEYTADGGKILPTKISTVGERSALLAGNNIGTAPFWVFTGSAGSGGSALDRSILVMSSSNINEAYGAGYYQGDLPYIAGPTEYFNGGTEPSNTQFPQITSQLEFFEGDEIRFGNNENYSYRILQVTPPEANIEGGKGRIKIKLDREVPQSINKDFFLIRRYNPKASSFILDIPFPYSSENSSSTANGIVFPTFPTEYIEKSGSVIVTDLISKGVIK